MDLNRTGKIELSDEIAAGVIAREFREPQLMPPPAQSLLARRNARLLSEWLGGVPAAKHPICGPKFPANRADEAQAVGQRILVRRTTFTPRERRACAAGQPAGGQNRT